MSLKGDGSRLKAFTQTPVGQTLYRADIHILCTREWNDYLNKILYMQTVFYTLFPILTNLTLPITLLAPTPHCIAALPAYPRPGIPRRATLAVASLNQK